MKATVIILTCNQADTIARAIGSVLRQECGYPFEILIADDGSTDATRTICRDYADRFPAIIRLMPQRPNRGLVENYFEAVLAARGSYISDCAGDDEWVDPTRLRRCIDMLDADPGLSVVFTDVERIEDAPGSKPVLTTTSDLPQYAKWRRPRINGRELLLGLLDRTNALPYILSSALYRKSVLNDALRDAPEAVRCPESGIEDVPVIAALAARGDAAHLPIVGYRYFITPRSLSNADSPERLYRIYAPAFSLTLKLARHYGIDPRRLQQHFKETTLYLASLCRRTQSGKLAADFRSRVAEWPMRLGLKARIHLLLTIGCRDSG